MSIAGGPPSSPPINPEKKKEIPLSWFTAVGTKIGGIELIVFSNEFLGLGGEELSECLDIYDFNVDGVEIHNSSEISDDALKTKVQAAEERIKNITGFSMQELVKKREELEAFIGKKDAPIELILTGVEDRRRPVSERDQAIKDKINTLYLSLGKQRDKILEVKSKISEKGADLRKNYPKEEPVNYDRYTIYHALAGSSINLGKDPDYYIEEDFPGENSVEVFIDRLIAEYSKYSI